MYIHGIIWMFVAFDLLACAFIDACAHSHFVSSTDLAQMS